jgi:hypothetical protein
MTHWRSPWTELFYRFGALGIFNQNPAMVAAVKATVLLSNHSEFVNAVNKNRMIAGLSNRPHPYEVGAESEALLPGHAKLRTRSTERVGEGPGEVLK